MAAAGCAQPASREGDAAARRIEARVTAVTDGDTLRARAAGSGRDYDVRLIGIDTPETTHPATPIECGGPEASASMERLAMPGRRGAAVTLTTDPSQDTRDQYGRLLAYATRSDGVDLAGAQLRAGWGEVYVYDRAFERLGSFESAERAARRGRLGVWGACGGDFHRPR
jgi:micrococcal nuclease